MGRIYDTIEIENQWELEQLDPNINKRWRTTTISRRIQRQTFSETK